MWAVALQPKKPAARIHRLGIIKVLDDDATMDQVAKAIEDMAWVFEFEQRVPKTEEWASTDSRVRVVKRTSRTSYQCRVQAFELKGEVGFSAGIGFLKAIRRPDE
jgi:hypothetical protein